MKKLAKVKDILNIYSSTGIEGLTQYFSNENLDIQENTWIYKVKGLLESKNIKSLEAEITLIIYNLKLSKNEKS